MPTLPAVVCAALVTFAVPGCVGDSCDNAADMLACSYPAERETPRGDTAEVSANRRLTVRNPGGEPVAHEGTRIFSGGGGFSEDEGGNVPDVVCEVADDSVLVIHDVLPPL